MTRTLENPLYKKKNQSKLTTDKTHYIMKIFTSLCVQYCIYYNIVYVLSPLTLSCILVRRRRMSSMVS